MEVIFLLGTAQAFFLSILVFNKKGKSHADLILGTWLAFMGIHLLYYYLFSTDFLFRYPHLLGTGAAFPQLEAPFMFVYVTVMIRKDGKFKLTDLLHALPFLFFTVYFAFIFYHLSGPEKLDFYNRILNGDIPLDVKIVSFPNIAIGPIYIVLALLKLKQHTKNISQRFSYTERINLNWLKYVIGGLGFVWIIVVVSNILVMFPFLSITAHEHLIYLALTMSVFFLGYFGIKQQAIYSHEPSLSPQKDSPEFRKKKEPGNQYLHSGLKKEYAEQYSRTLQDYFSSEKPYLNGKLSLSEVSQYMEISVNHLSQVINEQLNMTFFDFVNSYRVEEVKKRLSDSKYENFTLLGIAFDSGFNSKSSFNSIFKKFTGFTPSQYAAKTKN